MTHTNHELDARDWFASAYGLDTMEVGDELVVLDRLSGKSFRINASGAVIWRSVANGLNFTEIRETLEARFSLAPAEADEITREFLASLGSRGLVSRRRSQDRAREVEIDGRL